MFIKSNDAHPHGIAQNQIQPGTISGNNIQTELAAENSAQLLSPLQESYSTRSIHNEQELNSQSEMGFFSQNSTVNQLRAVYQKETSSDLIRGSILNQYNICVNLKHGIIFCQTCGSSTTLKQLIRHLSKKCTPAWNIDRHTRNALKVEIRNLITRIINEPLPLNVDGTGIDPVEGLPITLGYNCEDCDYCCSKRSAIERHLRRLSHNGFVSGKVQRILLGMNHKFLLVKDPEQLGTNLNPDVIALSDLLDETHSSAVKEYCEPEFNDEGFVELACPAREYVMNYERQMPSNFRREWYWLTQFSENLDEPFLVFFRSIVHNYFESIIVAQSEVLKVPLRWIMQLYKNDAPVKVFNGLQESRLTYADTLLSYCLFILRVSNDESIANNFFKLPDTIDRHLIASLRSAIVSECYEEAATHLNAMLLNHFTCKYNMGHGEYRIPVMQWLLLRCDSRRSGTGFVKANQITSVIAQMLYGIRGTILLAMKPRLNDNVTKKRQYRELLNCLYIDTPCAFASLHVQYRHLKRVSAIQEAPDRVIVDPTNHFQLNIDGKYLSVKMMERAMKNIIIETKQKVIGLLLGHSYEELEFPKLKKFEDNARAATIKYWFGSSVLLEEERFTKRMKDWLTNDHNLRNRFFEQKQDGSWGCREVAARHYLAKAEDMRDSLILAYHLTSGMPGRATEIAGFRISNRKYALRNFYAAGNTLYTVSRYSKNTSQSQKDEYIARFMIPEVAELFAVTFTVIRPVELYFAKFLNVQGLVSSLSEFAFPRDGHPILAQRICNNFKTTMLKMKIDLNFSAYRHVATAWSRYLLPKPPLDRQTDIYARQSGHSLKTHEELYAVETNTPQTTSRCSLNDFAFASRACQALFHLVDARNMNIRQEMVEKPETSQTAHSAIRNFNDADRTNDLHTLNYRYFATSVESDKNIQWETHLGDYSNASEGLRKLYGPNADFITQDQMNIISGSLRAAKDIIGVLATGGGKSAAFLVPAKLKSGITILILPVKVLLVEFLHVAREKGIDVKIFNNCASTADNVASLVLCAVESIDTVALHKFLHDCRDIRRIMIDEAHLCVIWKPWRDQLKLARTLRVIDVPLILLTGTLPPKYNQELEKLFMFNPVYIRGCPNRSNLKYIVKKFLTKDNLKHSLDFLAHFTNLSSRYIIYCATKNEARDLQAYIAENIYDRILLYHSEMPDLERIEAVTKWRRGDSLGVVATSAFGMGVDYPGVRLVLVIGGSYSYADLIQQFGRAGRDGQAADCLLWTTEQQLNDIRRVACENDSSQTALNEYLAMREYAENTNECRRWRITKYLGGQLDGMPCLGSRTNVRCDVCDMQEHTNATPLEVEARPSIHPSVRFSAAQTREVLQRNQQEAATIVNFLKRVKGHCLACLVMYSELRKHSSCTLYHGRCLRCFDSSHKVRACRIVNRVSRGYCYRCHLPAKVGEIALHFDHAFGDTCTNDSDIIRNICWILYHGRHDILDRYNRGQLQAISRDDFGKWLGTECNDETLLNSSILFLWFCTAVIDIPP